MNNTAETLSRDEIYARWHASHLRWMQEQIEDADVRSKRRAWRKQHPLLLAIASMLAAVLLFIVVVIGAATWGVILNETFGVCRPMKPAVMQRQGEINARPSI